MYHRIVESKVRSRTARGTRTPSRSSCACAGGRILEIHTLEDTQVLARALDVVAASGNDEAHAPPITDAGLP